MVADTPDTVGILDTAARPMEVIVAVGTLAASVADMLAVEAATWVVAADMAVVVTGKQQ